MSVSRRTPHSICGRQPNTHKAYGHCSTARGLSRTRIRKRTLLAWTSPSVLCGLSSRVGSNGARAGEEIVVTDRGSPVARLVAVDSAPLFDQLTQRGVQRAWD